MESATSTHVSRNTPSTNAGFIAAAMFNAGTNAVLLAIIVFGDLSETPVKYMMLAGVLSFNLIGFLWTSDRMKAFADLSKDQTAEEAATVSGQAWSKTPFGAYQGVILLTTLALAGTEIWAIFS